MDDLDNAVAALQAAEITPEPKRIDEYTGKTFTFFAGPDGHPLELYASCPSVFYEQ